MTSLAVQDLSYAYGKKRALYGVSFSVERGRFCALLGPNGAGKSTLYALLTRLFVTQTGRITVAGHDMAHKPRAALAKIGVVFQQPTLDIDLSVRRNLLYFARLHGMTGAKAERNIAVALERLDMASRASERVRDLNGGHRRRTEIARALVHEPDILLLDEPTVGLDADARQSITDYIHTACAETALTVLWATHLTDEVMPTDQVVILHRGEVLADEDAQTIAGGGTLKDRFLALTANLSDDTS